MGLEAATGIYDLVATNPTGTDDMSKGDDHIRLIKATLLNTFANVTGAVTSSHTELNYLDGVTGTTGSGSLVLNSAPDIDGVMTGGFTLSTDNASASEAGYRGLPLNNQSDNYTLVLSDAGGAVRQSVASKTFTIPSNASVPYPLGTTIVIINGSSGNLSLAITSDSLYWLDNASAASGTRTIGKYSVATIIKITSTVWNMWGTALS